MDALPYVRRGYAAYVIAVLFLAYMFAYLDRQVIGLLTPALKASLDLTDVQVSLLHGLAFVSIFALAGLPAEAATTGAVLLLVLSGQSLWRLGNMALFDGAEVSQMLSEVMFVLILMEVYRLLIFYLREHRISVALALEVALVSTLREVILKGAHEFEGLRLLGRPLPLRLGARSLWQSTVNGGPGIVASGLVHCRLPLVSGSHTASATQFECLC